MDPDATPRVDADIRRASTLPAAFYRSRDAFEAVRERVFARSWQWLGHEADVTASSARPVTLLPGLLDEPLVLARDAGGSLRCLSNVCTHRGNLVCTEAGPCSHLRCGYHGRRFRLDGRFEFMPEFAGAEGFPSAADDLPSVPLASFGGLLFASLAPETPFDAWIDPVRGRVGHLPFDELRLDPSRSRDYEVAANWALYVDNYLEGFHVPYVHPGLAERLDYASYAVELFPHSSLQLGVARPGEPTFEVPPGSPDAGRAVGAYYLWLHPSTMLNLYPWGLSLNVVLPLDVDRTRVSVLAYVWRPELLDRGPGAELDRVEQEDEAVVEQVQRGIRSRLYTRGRYSPAREPAVHHFHRLLQASLD